MVHETTIHTDDTNETPSLSQNNSTTIHQAKGTSCVPDLVASIETNDTVKTAAHFLSRTAVNEFDETTGEQKHAALVCVVCDSFIIGMEPVHWIETKTLLKHKGRLSA